MCFYLTKLPLRLHQVYNGALQRRPNVLQDRRAQLHIITLHYAYMCETRVSTRSHFVCPHLSIIDFDASQKRPGFRVLVFNPFVKIILWETNINIFLSPKKCAYLT